MGLFRTFILFPFLLVGSATYCAFSLGPLLPVASRRAGRAIGMGFNYFKVALRVLTEPAADQTNFLVSQYRMGS